MSSTISPATSLAELVVEQPSRSRVFERFGLDYCCGGYRSLEDVCRERGIAVPEVLAALSTSSAERPATDWTATGIPALVDHIVEVHHARLREDLPRLSRLLEAVVRAHGAERTQLIELRSVFEQLRCQLEAHLAEEEETLFPACRETAAGERTISAETVSLLELEHAEAGGLLERLSELTGGYATDHALCGTHRAAVDGLRELASDLHEHVHLENNVLFPQVRTLVLARGR
jgi:regulator of cell morphogenesis and NO signaling